MELLGNVVLSYLEQDNTQRSFFRVRPLLHIQGAFTKQHITGFPSEGYLRIVPDKDEQTTFKERMKSLGSICLIDLRTVPKEANKIRTNKNFSPARGEVNQFVVYSDAIKPVTQDTFYEVVTADNISSASTPFLLTRSGGNIYGPVNRETAQPVENAEQVPPDSPKLFTVTLPNGAQKLYYCALTEMQPEPVLEKAEVEVDKIDEPVEQNAPKEEEQPTKPQLVQQVSPMPQAQNGSEEKQERDNSLESAKVAIQKLNTQQVASTNRLDASSAPLVEFAPHVGKKLKGTPIYSAGVPKDQRATPRNSLIETVHQQRGNTRYDAPGAELVRTAETKSIENPLEQLKDSLATLWNVDTNKRQCLDIITQLTGFKKTIANWLLEGENDCVLSALRTQLQELEAERIMVVMQLDKATKDASAQKEQWSKELLQQKNNELVTLEGKVKKLQSALQTLHSDCEQIICQRDALLSEVNKLTETENPYRFSPKLGVSLTIENAIERLSSSLNANGFASIKNEVIALLVAYALSDGQLAIKADTLSDALDIGKAFVHAFGGEFLSEKDQTLSFNGGGNTPCVMFSETTSLESDSRFTRFILVNHLTAKTQHFQMNPCAICSISNGTGIMKEVGVNEGANMNELVAGIISLHKSLPAQATTLLSSIRKTLHEQGVFVPNRMYTTCYNFVSIAQQIMDGGVASALDTAIEAYILPYAKQKPVALNALKLLCKALPKVQKAQL